MLRAISAQLTQTADAFFGADLMLNVALPSEKICYTAVKHNSSVNDQMFCSLMALALHTYNNRVNNTRLWKQTAPLLPHTPPPFPRKRSKKTITKLAGTDAAITKTQWHCQFVFCPVFVFNLLLKKKASKPPQPTPQPPPPDRSRVASSCVKQLEWIRFWKGGCSAITQDWKRPSSMSPDAAEERGAKGHDLGIGFLVGVCIPKKKGTRQLSTLSLRSPQPPPAALHPQQRHILLNNGHSDQRGIPALCLSPSLSTSTYSVNWSGGWRTYWLFSPWYTD